MNFDDNLIPPPPPLRTGFPAMPSRNSISVPNISNFDQLTDTPGSPVTVSEGDLSLAAREKLNRSLTVDRGSYVKPTAMPDIDSGFLCASQQPFCQKRSFTDIPAKATDLLRLPAKKNDNPLSDSLPPVPARTIRRKPLPAPRQQPSIASLKSHSSNEPRAISPSKASPSGGWISGYMKDSNPHIAELKNELKLKQSLENHAPLHHIDSSSNTSVNISQASLRAEDTRNNSITQQPRRRSLMTTEKPSLTLGDSQTEVDLSDILDGVKKLSIDGKGDVKYEIDGCVCMFDYGFVLSATKISGNKKKKVYIKMVNRRSESYAFAQKYVNPEHTELALLTSRKAKHLPEYIEHFIEPDYLVIVTKTHGLKKKGVLPFTERYHDVQWIYWFNQAV